MARSAIGAAETRAIHEVMELVRGNPALSSSVLRLRDNGLSWRDVKTAIDPKPAGGTGNRRSIPPLQRKATRSAGKVVGPNTTKEKKECDQLPCAPRCSTS